MPGHYIFFPEEKYFPALSFSPGEKHFPAFFKDDASGLCQDLSHSPTFPWPNFGNLIKEAPAAGRREEAEDRGLRLPAGLRMMNRAK